MNELMIADENGLQLSLTNAAQFYCSFVPKTDAEKVNFFNQINSPSHRLKEVVNMELPVKDIYAERCEFVNADTGEVRPGVRMVFITPDGEGYQAASQGIFTSTQKLFQIMGTPDTWKAPIKIRPKEISKGANRNVLVFELA